MGQTLLYYAQPYSGYSTIRTGLSASTVCGSSSSQNGGPWPLASSWYGTAGLSATRASHANAYLVEGSHECARLESRGNNTGRQETVNAACWPLGLLPAFRLLIPCVLLMAACSRQEPRVWNEEGAYRVAALRTPVGGGVGFTELRTSRTGIDFTNELDYEAWQSNRHYVNGSGVALGDVDGDDWPDVFLSRLNGRNALYLNRGDWRFEEVAADAGVAAPYAVTTGAVLADIDGDADLDLLLTSMGGGTTVFENDGAGSFTDITVKTGLAHSGGATSMALADVEGDGDLDLYVGYYKSRTVKDMYPPGQLAFERVVRQEGDTYAIVPEFDAHYRLVRQGNRLMRFEYAEPDRLYLNDGNGHFSHVGFEAGVFRGQGGLPLAAEPRDWALTARFQDFNGDGIPDLFVCNDFESPDHFWLGDGQGGFAAAPALSIRKTSQSTMSIAAGDVNGDGFVDIFLADMLSMQYKRRQRQHQVIPPEVAGIGRIDVRPQIMQNMLLLGRGDGTYAETSNMAGVAASEWTWSSLFLDVDLDGHEDLLLTTGHAYDAMDGDAQMRSGAPGDNWRQQLQAFPDLDLKNLAFRNHGDGTFSLMPDGWGLGVAADVSHGLALADLDQDGDLDAVVNRLNAVAGVFRNDAAAPRIAVRLRGMAPNTQGVGALIRVTGDNLPLRQEEVLAGGLYLSSSEAIKTFAAQETVTIEVRWRSGLRSVMRGASASHIYEVFESSASIDTVTEGAASPPTLMAEAPLDLVHHEAPYEDFARQPLLPRRLSQRGPAIALADLDADGDDDIIMGNGRGGHLTYVLNTNGTFGSSRTLGAAATGDHAGVVVAPGRMVTASNSSYERTPENADAASTVRLLHMPVQDSANELGFGKDVPGPLVLADFDGDQELDLFVGGHFLPGRYPHAASSRVYRGADGQFIYDGTMSKAFAGIGLVSGATAGDLDNDGDLDLVLAMDWGPVRVLLNNGHGDFGDRTSFLGLASSTGWWNGVALGDFDSDGRLDIVATNWGNNTMYSSTSRPLIVFYGDIDRNGIMDILESYYDESLQDYGMVRDFRALSDAIPPLLGRVHSYREFSELSTAELFDGALSPLEKREAETLLNTACMSRGKYFVAEQLPGVAQWAPAFAAAVADFDGDGAEDLFLSQNFSATPASTPRMDAGRGLLLRGDGQGGFMPLDGSVTGIRVYGEQRGAAVGDLNQDGRTDLVVTQNAGSAKLFLNAGGTPGLRVILRGPMSGIGATLRVRYADGTMGPARVVSVGSGYWSQNSMEQVLGIASRPSTVWVRWPGGVETETPVAEGHSTIIIEYDDGG